jgi:hypothetical protein
MQTHKHNQNHILMQTRMHAHAHTHTYTHTQSRIHNHARTPTCTLPHAHTCTLTTRTQSVTQLTRAPSSFVLIVSPVRSARSDLHAGGWVSADQPEHIPTCKVNIHTFPNSNNRNDHRLSHSYHHHHHHHHHQCSAPSGTTSHDSQSHGDHRLGTTVLHWTARRHATHQLCGPSALGQRAVGLTASAICSPHRRPDARSRRIRQVPLRTG